MSLLRHLLAAFIVVVISALSAPVHAQVPNMATGAGMGQQVQLSEQSAKNAIDAYLVLKKMFGGDKMAATTGPGGALAGLAASKSFLATVRSHGFKDGLDWQRTLTSFIMTHSMVKEGKLAEFDQSIAKMKGNPSVPPHVLEMMKRMRPTDNNIKVMRSVAADPAYAAKIEEARR